MDNQEELLKTTTIQHIAKFGAEFIKDSPYPKEWTILDAARAYVRVTATKISERPTISRIDSIADCAAAAFIVTHRDEIVEQILKLLPKSDDGQTSTAE